MYVGQGAPQIIVCRKGLYNFEKDFVWQSHALFYHECKTGWIRNIGGNEVLIKERCYLSVSLEPDVEASTGDAFDCLVGDLKSSSITCCFLLFQFFFFTNYYADCFLCIHECNTPVIILLVDHNIWDYACFKLAQDRTPWDICCCSGSASSTEAFVTKHTDSILSPAFLRISIVCNRKILPTILW